MLGIFHMFLGHFYFLFSKLSGIVPCPLFIGWLVFFLPTVKAYVYLNCIFVSLFVFWLNLQYFCPVGIWGFYVEEYIFFGQQFLDCESELEAFPLSVSKRILKRPFKNVSSPAGSRTCSWAASQPHDAGAPWHVLHPSHPQHSFRELKLDEDPCSCLLSQ